MLSYEATMAIGQARYQDVIDRLKAQGLLVVFTQTGGMCAALEVQLETGHTLLVTDADDTLSWDWAEHEGWRVGLFLPGDEYAEEPLAYRVSEDGSAEALLPLIRQVLGDYLRRGSSGERSESQQVC